MRYEMLELIHEELWRSEFFLRERGIGRCSSLGHDQLETKAAMDSSGSRLRYLYARSCVKSVAVARAHLLDKV